MMTVRNVASPFKVTWHKEKLEAFRRGERFFPATLELDLTSRCTRSCSDCPSSRSDFQTSLDQDFVDRLLGTLEGKTRGLLLTGGEPTMSELFGWTLSEARRRGFEEIAVVTNGSLLEREEVVSALLIHATTVRVSLYDLSAKNCAGPGLVLKSLEKLRARIDSAGSSLQIGVSLLTSGNGPKCLCPWRLRFVQRERTGSIFIRPASDGERERRFRNRRRE